MGTETLMSKCRYPLCENIDKAPQRWGRKLISLTDIMRQHFHIDKAPQRWGRKLRKIIIDTNICTI